MITPEPLPPGSRIALVAPAGPLAAGAIGRAVGRVRDLGWEPVVGEHADGRHGYLAAPDGERLADLNRALADPEIDGVWALRGGYGTMRILTDVDWAGMIQRPRPLIGFSDNTALHLAAARHGLVTFHGPHPATAEFTAFSRDALLLALGGKPAGPLPMPKPGETARRLVGGTGEGRLVGGNLSLIAATLGTPYQIRPGGGILFFEEVGEPVYRLDRLLSQLLLAGVLDQVSGIAIGAVSDCPDVDSDQLPDPDEVLHDRLGHLGIPVVSGFPFGHIDRSWTLPHGIQARLDADRPELSLLEAAVTGGAA